MSERNNHIALEYSQRPCMLADRLVVNTQQTGSGNEFFQHINLTFDKFLVNLSGLSALVVERRAG